jgi:hypothetical protein
MVARDTCRLLLLQVMEGLDMAPHGTVLQTNALHCSALHCNALHYPASYLVVPLGQCS